MKGSNLSSGLVSTDYASVAIKLLVKVEIKEKEHDIMPARPFNQRHFVDDGYGIVCWHISQILWCFETLNKGEKGKFKLHRSFLNKIPFLLSIPCSHIQFHLPYYKCEDTISRNLKYFSIILLFQA